MKPVQEMVDGKLASLLGHIKGMGATPQEAKEIIEERLIEITSGNISDADQQRMDSAEKLSRIMARQGR